MESKIVGEPLRLLLLEVRYSFNHPQDIDLGWYDEEAASVAFKCGQKGSVLVRTNSGQRLIDSGRRLAAEGTER